MTKSELRKTYKKSIYFDSSPLAGMLWFSVALLVVMFILELTLKSCKNYILGTLLVLLAIPVLLMIYFVIREELQRIRLRRKEWAFEFSTTDENLFIVNEYLLSNHYWRADKRKNSNLSAYTNSYTPYVGIYIINVLVVNDDIKMKAFIKNNRKRGFSKHGLYGMMLYPAKLKFRKHLAVVLELLGAPEEFKI